MIYRTEIAQDWVDYNGHLRDAYYGLIVSYASDALMDTLGMDAAYRQRTRNTLYTVEMHIHFLHELKKSDTVGVNVRVLGTDRKRIHAAFDVVREADGVVAASVEEMLLHVHQGEVVKTVAFSEEISAKIAALAAGTATSDIPGSRRMEIPTKGS